MKTLAIIPAFNEEASLPNVLRTLQETLPGVDVLVIDDGSRDDTATVARNAGALVAQLPFNMGIGAALRTGFRFAADGGYDRAFQFDADGQHDAAEVRKLLDRLDDGADMVIGTRFSGAEDVATEYEVGRTRGFAMSLLRALIRTVLGRRFTDTSSGFRAFNRPVIEYFAVTYPREYMDSVEALVSASYRGFRVEEVGVTMHEREAGVPSNRNFKLVYHYLRLVLVLVVTASRDARRAKVAA
jgi:glycosyltransferase involved in cell wall biosynthesis